MKTMNPLIQRKKATRILLTLALLCLGLLPQLQAVTPPPDGGYPGGNTAEGDNALFSLTDGPGNTAIGFEALFSNTIGLYNTATGASSLHDNVSGFRNTATGVEALYFSGGDENTATGVNALHENQFGDGNTATGFDALHDNTTGDNNSATGRGALRSNTTGDGNTATGFHALHANVSGGNNSAIGRGALKSNTDGDLNTAIGFQALFGNDHGNGNTATGFGALNSNTTGNDNTANGRGALLQNTSGSRNTAIGMGAGSGVTNASDVICIGFAVAGADVSNTAWIGNVYGVTTQSGTTAPVVVSDTGQLGTLASSERFKKDIVTMDNVSDAILSLRPVTFHYKTDTQGTPQFGLIAEEVAKVNPALVLPDKEGKPYTVRYEAVNAMLLNEFLKEHRKNEQQEATIARLETQIEALTTGLQKVSVQLEASKPAPQVVNNP